MDIILFVLGIAIGYWYQPEVTAIYRRLTTSRQRRWLSRRFGPGRE